MNIEYSRKQLLKMQKARSDIRRAVEQFNVAIDCLIEDLENMTYYDDTFQDMDSVSLRDELRNISEQFRTASEDIGD